MKKLAAMAVLGLMAFTKAAVPAQAPDAPPAAAAATDKVAMRLALTPRKFSFRLTSSISSKETAGGQTGETIANSSFTYAVSVAGVNPDGSMALDVTSVSYVGDVKSPLFTGGADTTQPSAAVAPMLKHWTALPGSMYRVTINPDGTVKSVEGAEPIQQKVLAAIDPSVIAMRPLIEPAIKASWSPEGLKEQWESIFLFYSPAPVGAGEQWTKTRDVNNGPMARAMSTQYAIKERKGGYSLIEFTGTSTPLAAPPEFEGMAGLKLRPLIGGAARGQITYHEETGWPYSVTAQERLEGKLTVTNASRGVPSEILLVSETTSRLETGP